MNHRDSNQLNRSVRLFPRLADADPTGRVSHRRGKLAGRTTNSLPNTDSIASATQMRARLLKMILDNEQVRRNERRPNQA
jgi:hypothetical protein